MLAFLLSELLGDYSLYPLVVLLLAFAGGQRQSSVDTPIDPEDSKFIKEADFMFPENFLSRYPHEANAFRLKIFTYLIFNLLVKGYGSVDPEKVWLNYNSEDYSRVLIDAAFYEYLANFTDSKDKDFAFILSKSTRRYRSESNSDIAVDRIGQYLDHLSETESNPERLKDAYEILSELQTAECDMQTLIQSSGKPGIDYPNFCDIPETSFSCDGKRIPGIYADFETGCQVFHVCWPHRIDSFLCPIGTVFNQSLLTCDLWHATGCYSSPLFFDRDQFLIDGISTKLDVPEPDGSCQSLLNKPLRLHTKFLPAKCEVIDLEGSKQVETKPQEKDVDIFQMRLDMAHDMVREMLDMLREIRKELTDEMKNRGAPWIHLLPRSLEKYVPKPSTETMERTTEFAKKLGETAERVHHSRKISSETKPEFSVTRSSHLKPSKSLIAHLKRSRKQDVSEIELGSLRMGGNILNEGIIPLIKQVIIDSYRKIKSRKH